MSKKKISLTKLKPFAEKASEKKPKQITISKFFSTTAQSEVAQDEKEPGCRGRGVAPIIITDDDPLHNPDTSVISTIVMKISFRGVCYV